MKFDTNNSRTLTVALVALVALSALALPVASAATVTHADGTTVVNETVTLDNATTSVWVEVSNASTSEPLNATVHGVETANNSTTSELVGSTNVTAQNTTSVAELSIDGMTWDSARVEVVAPNGSTIESHDVGVVTRVSGGAGGSTSSGLGLSSGQLIGGAVAVVILILLGIGVKQ